MGYSPGGGGGGSGPSPATTVTGPDAYSSPAVVGTNTNYARQDHDHGLPAAPAVPAAATTVTGPDAYGASAVVGTGTNYARQDHDHGLPAAPAVPAAATTVTGPDAYGASAVVGTGTNYARQDHDHGLPAAPADLPLAGGTMSGAIAMGTNKITGLGNGSATQDGAAFGQIPTASSTVTGPDSYGASAAVGSATTFSKGDHNHGLPAAPAAAALATAKEIAVGTGSTTIVTLAPAAAGNYHIGIYFRVITAITNVTITVTWTDVTGAQTLTLLSVVAETVGSYTLTDFMIDSVITSPITVSMTAGTVSQVLASASILQG
jgi:hypothetical protein